MRSGRPQYQTVSIVSYVVIALALLSAGLIWRAEVKAEAARKKQAAEQARQAEETVTQVQVPKETHQQRLERFRRDSYQQAMKELSQRPPPLTPEQEDAWLRSPEGQEAWKRYRYGIVQDMQEAREHRRKGESQAERLWREYGVRP